MGFTIIQPKTEKEYYEYFLLRWEILRKPWNQPKIIAPVESDDSSTHFSVINTDKKTVGVCRLHFNTDQEVQVRFVAIHSAFQGNGIGKLIMQKVENFAQNNGATKMILHARENAVPFYKNLNYSVIKKTHLLFGKIQHYLMEKEL